MSVRGVSISESILLMLRLCTKVRLFAGEPIGWLAEKAVCDVLLVWRTAGVALSSPAKYPSI